MNAEHRLSALERRHAACQFEEWMESISRLSDDELNAIIDSVPPGDSGGESVDVRTLTDDELDAIVRQAR